MINDNNNNNEGGNAAVAIHENSIGNSSEGSTIEVGNFIGHDSFDSRKLSSAKATKVANYCVKKFDNFIQSEDYQSLQRSPLTKKRTMKRLRHSQIEIGELLGEGGFSTVYEVRKCLNEEIDVDSDRCVVKMLRKKALQNPPMLAACALGLAKEGQLLSMLEHPHILTVRGTATGGLASYASGRNDCFFLILDRLSETLTDRLINWSYRPEHASRFSLFPKLRKQQKACFTDRLVIASQLADAVAHMHKHNIMHRDLKPDNIGFDVDGSLKVFDLDVARVTPEGKTEDETFKLTQKIGTRRYMSPEIGLSKKYNLKSDTYSFAIILWQIMALKLPFSQYFDKQAHTTHVFAQGERPKLQKAWPTDLQTLLSDSWSKHISRRPTMQQVHIELQREINVLTTKWSTPVAPTAAPVADQ